MSSTDSINKSSSEVRVYRSRWYILIVASLATALQVILWGSWGPIAQSAKAVYDWQDSTVTLMFSLANIATVLCIIPAAYIMDGKGLRMAMLICTLTLALGSGLRVITFDKQIATWLIGFGQFLVGIASSVTCSLPPLLSETWFPSNERATATAITAVSMATGSSLNFLIGPSVISEPFMNGSKILLNETDISHIRTQLRNLNLSFFGVAAFLLLLTLIYFPTRPPHPPSASAAVNRHKFKQGLLKLVRNKFIWLITVTYAIPMGIFTNFSGILDVILKAIDVKQTEAGWIGFYGGIAATLGGMIAGRLADVFKRRMKFLIMLLYLCAGGFFAWMACIVGEILTKSMVSLYIAGITGTFFIYATQPLFFEITCETSYPTAEGVTGGFMAIMLNLSGIAFLLISMTGIGTLWMPWCVTGSLVLALPLLYAFKEHYQRLDVDTNVVAETVNGDSSPYVLETDSTDENSIKSNGIVDVLRM